MDMPCEDDVARERTLTVNNMMVAELPKPPCFLCGKKEDEVNQRLIFSSEPDYTHSAPSR